MASLGLPEPYAEIDRLIEAGDIGGAARALATVTGDTKVKEVLAAKLGVLSGALSTDAALQKLIQLMRERSDLPGARELYQEVTNLTYSSHESSVAYSHPPPPMTPKKNP
jgi:hypothetical protein